MQDQSVTERKLPRFKQNLVSVSHIRHAACTPLLMCMNSHAIRAGRRNIGLIVMVREIDVIHAKFSRSSFMQSNTTIGWLTKPLSMILQRNRAKTTRISPYSCNGDRCRITVDDAAREVRLHPRDPHIQCLTVAPELPCALRRVDM